MSPKRRAQDRNDDWGPATELGRLIQDRRRVVGINQTQLAEACGTTQQTLSRWESAKISPPSPMLVKLAKALEVDIGVLFEALGVQTEAQSRTGTPLTKDEQRVAELQAKVDAQQADIKAMRDQLGRVLALMPAEVQAEAQARASGSGTRRRQTR